jgi:hypothetical protein
MRKIHILLASNLLYLTGLAGSPVLAQFAPSAAEPLPAVIRRERGNFRPLTQADVNSRRAELNSAVDRLERYLATGGANGANWRRYLRWNEMRAELQKGPDADLELLDEIQTLYASGHAGFEMPVYANVGKALRQYIDTLYAVTDAEARAHYEARIDALAADVEAYLQNPTQADTHRAGMILGELVATRQSPAVVQAVRRALSNPNLLIDASQRFVSAGINEAVNDVGPMTDVILGTRIYGTVQTVGSVTAELGNASQHAAIDLMMRGTAYSRNVGYNGPAIIHSTGMTGLAARKRLILDEYGLRAYPAASNARTRTRITDVDVTSHFLRGIVENIATNRVYQSKSRAESIASQHAQARLNTRIDEQSQSLIAQGNRDFWTRFRYPLMRFGAFPEQLHFSSFADRLSIRATRADSYQLGAPGPAPPLAAATDVSVRMHESTIDNFASTVLAGRTLTRDEANRLFKNITGRLPEESDEEDARDWSVTFAPEKPIEMAIDDGAARVTVRIDEFVSGDTLYDQKMNVTANYKLEMNGQDGLRAVRQGELEIYPPDFKPGEDRLSASQQSLKTVLERRFGRIFKPELPEKPQQGLDLPGRWKAAGPLPLTVLAADAGWLSLGWNKPTVIAPMPGPALGTIRPVIHPGHSVISR